MIKMDIRKLLNLFECQRKSINENLRNIGLSPLPNDIYLYDDVIKYLNNLKKDFESEIDELNVKKTSYEKEGNGFGIEKELRIKLQQKWYNSDEIRYTMDYLKSKKFADDRVFAESYIRSELVNKWKPVIAVTNKLYQKWVDKKLINEVIKDYQEDISVGVFQKIRKEIDSYKKRWVDWFDIIQKLMRKGYRLEDIKTVIKLKV